MEPCIPPPRSSPWSFCHGGVLHPAALDEPFIALRWSSPLSRCLGRAVCCTTLEEPCIALSQRRPSSRLPEEPVFVPLWRSCSSRRPGLLVALHHIAPDELFITPCWRIPSSRRTRGAVHHVSPEVRFIALPGRSPSSCHHGGAVHRAAPVFLEPFIAPPRSSFLIRRAGGAHRRTTPKIHASHFSGGALHRAVLEEPIVAPQPRSMHHTSPEERFIAPPWRSPSSCHHGGAVHRAALVFLEPFVTPPQRSPLLRRPGGGLHRPAPGEPCVLPRWSSASSFCPGGAHFFIAPPTSFWSCSSCRPGGALHHALAEEPIVLLPWRSCSLRRPGLLGSLHHATPEEPFNAPCRRSHSSCHGRGAPGRATLEELLIASARSSWSPSSRRAGGAHCCTALLEVGLHLTIHVFLELFVVPPRRSPSSRFARGAHHPSAPEKPFITLRQRNPWSCHPGGAVDRISQVFLEPIVAPPARSPSPRRAGGADRCAALLEEPYIALCQRSCAIAPHQRSPSSLCPALRGVIHRAAPEELVIWPSGRIPASHRAGAAHHHFTLEEPFIAARQSSPSLCRPGGAVHRAAQVFLEPLIAPPWRRALHPAVLEQPIVMPHRRRSSLRCCYLLGALHRTTLEEPYIAPSRKCPASSRSGGALHCATLEEPVVLPRSSWSPSSCHAGAAYGFATPEHLFVSPPRSWSPSSRCAVGALHRATQVFLEACIMPHWRSPVSRCPGEGVHCATQVFLDSFIVLRRSSPSSCRTGGTVIVPPRRSTSSCCPGGAVHCAV
ncbi:uncharacterized protein LOC142081263 [Calonectris borealis]|uniref:uncharacterized protein LOC142081263 n=1 Tax=Calonectris borealis TaxID=1323832 RepID=UPI003F4BFCF2